METEDWIKESETLDEMLSAHGFNVKSGEFYANGYNAPMDFTNRRNEVWKIKI